MAANVNMLRFYQFARPSRLVFAPFATEAVRTARIIYAKWRTPHTFVPLFILFEITFSYLMIAVFNGWNFVQK